MTKRQLRHSLRSITQRRIYNWCA